MNLEFENYRTIQSNQIHQLIKTNELLIEANESQNIKINQLIEANESQNIKINQLIETNESQNIKINQLIEANEKQNIKINQLIEANERQHSINELQCNEIESHRHQIHDLILTKDFHNTIIGLQINTINDLNISINNLSDENAEMNDFLMRNL